MGRAEAAVALAVSSSSSGRPEMPTDGWDIRVLEHAENAPEADRLVLLCLAAGRHVVLDPRESNAALRRAYLLLAAGGDPRRPLELHGRAVTALADDLDTPNNRAQLATGLSSLHEAATGLRLTTAALNALCLDSELAWQCFSMALLARALADEE